MRIHVKLVQFKLVIKFFEDKSDVRHRASIASVSVLNNTYISAM